MKTALLVVIFAISFIVDLGVSTMLPLTTTFYREEGGHKIVQMIENSKYMGRTERVACYIYADIHIIDRMMKSIPKVSVKQVNKEEMRDLVKECSESTFNKQRNEEFRFEKNRLNSFDDFLQSFAIFPGTKWCGAGDIAENDEDLGSEVETDKCCRTHDKCNDSIPAGQEKHGLKNDGSFTKSNCACDEEFRSCLKNSTNEKSSTAVGIAYFDTLRIQCFKNEYPIIKCTETCGPLPLLKSCDKYELDYSAEKKYQFFDAKCYL